MIGKFIEIQQNSMQAILPGRIMQSLGIVGFCVVGALSCDSSVEQKPEVQPTRNAEYERQIAEMQSELDGIEETNDSQSDGLQVTSLENAEIKQEHNEYLKTLYANINDTKAEHLPEWQDMYEVLVDQRALETDEILLGSEALPNNFRRLYLISDENRGSLNLLAEDFDILTEDVQKLADENEVIKSNVQTINADVASINHVLATELASALAKINAYEERIIAVENLANTYEFKIENLKNEMESKVTIIQARLDEIDAILQENPPALLHEKIKINEETLTEVQTNLVNVQAQVNAFDTDLTTLQNQVTNNNEKVLDLSFKVATLQDKDIEIGDKVSVNETNLAAAQAKIAEIEGQLQTSPPAQLASRVQANEQAVTTMQAATTTLQAQTNAIEADLTAIDGKATENAEKIEDLSFLAISLQDKDNELMNSLVENSDKISDLNFRLGNVEDEVFPNGVP